MLLFRVPKSHVVKYLQERLGTNLILATQAELDLPEERRREWIPVSKENAHLAFMANHLHADENDCVTLTLEEAMLLEFLDCNFSAAERREVAPADVSAAG